MLYQMHLPMELKCICSYLNYTDFRLNISLGKSLKTKEVVIEMYVERLT